MHFPKSALFQWHFHQHHQFHQFHHSHYSYQHHYGQQLHNSSKNEDKQNQRQNDALQIVHLKIVHFYKSAFF